MKALVVIVLGVILRIGVPLALTLIAGYLIERWQRRGTRAEPPRSPGRG